jgi:hypothetical protein
MCRADVHPAAESALAALLDDMARALAEWVGVDRADVTIGPVDLGAPEPDGEY